ncbi:hypothetical protein [Hufsiella ginkgonis]|uniref:Uncharacterized protein n=1 Tax=Hufsiella ginkgonis TaxID=2695274 RepID=A0A7K1XY94_9SPHI|nr:hypothetical protein [Hufsiella ginkgonis]MXV15974.1 hypothetical protein [Hufsiella ginkgonis]
MTIDNVQELVEGYNDGRILDNKYKPELAKNLNASQAEKNEYLNGLKEGLPQGSRQKKRR